MSTETFDSGTLPYRLKLLMGLPLRALIVDDIADSRELIREALGEGVETFEATDGEEGLARAGELLPDLITLDVKMPVMNGVEVLRALKTDERLKEMAVIMLTGVKERKTVMKIVTAGVDDYIIKPLRPAVLREKVEKLMGEEWRHPLPEKLAVLGLTERFGVQVVNLLRPGEGHVGQALELCYHLARAGRLKLILNLDEVEQFAAEDLRAIAEMHPQLVILGATLLLTYRQKQRLEEQLAVHPETKEIPCFESVEEAAVMSEGK